MTPDARPDPEHYWSWLWPVSMSRVEKVNWCSSAGGGETEWLYGNMILVVSVSHCNGIRLSVRRGQTVTRGPFAARSAFQSSPPNFKK